MDLLIQQGIKDIITGNEDSMPHFEYYTDDKKLHIYYPDIYIPNEQKIIEVKSDFTYNQDIENIKYKALKVSETFLFELYIYRHKKLLYITQCQNGIFKNIYGNLDIQNKILF